MRAVKRKRDTHKGDYGRVLIVAGSSGMLGAAVLASRGALRSGAGLVYLAVPKELVNFANTMTPEVIVLPFEKIKAIKPDVIAIGPGLSTSKTAKQVLLSTINYQLSTLVADADAINIISSAKNILRKTKAKIILTPHPGEMSRLIGRSIEYIQKNRNKVARDFAKKYNCTVVLKGHKTVVADRSGKVYVNSTGNPGMATGGVGDVLTGMIAGLLAQNIPVEQAVYLHGLAGDLAAREKGEYGMIATDLAEKIPYAIQKSR